MDEQTQPQVALSVKAVGDWEIDILGVPYGDEDHKDAQGEFFTADTKYREDLYGLPPLVYYHGLDEQGKPTGTPEYIGRTVKRWVDERGIWFRGVLDKASALAKRVWEAAQEGVARASSGSISHLTRTEDNGRILEWPVAELSVFDLGGGKRPANPYAVAIPAMRAVYEAAGLTLPADIGDPEAKAEGAAQVASPEAAVADVPIEQSSDKQGVTEMEANEFKAMLDAAMQPVLAKVEQTAAGLEAIKREPPKDALAGTVVVRDEADTLYASIGEQLVAIAKGTKRGRYEPRLQRLKAMAVADNVGDEAMKQTGAWEGNPAAGGFLLEPTVADTLMVPMHQEGPFTRMVRRLPVGTNSNSGWINGVDETSRADGSRWGGLRGYRLGEGDLKTPSKPKFRRINWELKKYAVLVWATDELLEDAAQFSEVVRVGCGEELAFMANLDILRGNGAGGPLGILNSGALVTVAAEAGQLVDTVVNENIDNMWRAMLPWSKPRSAWFINSEVAPQLDNVAIAIGASALEPRFVTYDAQGTIRIKGRPVYETEFNSALGDVGDIVLADMNEYLFWEKGGVQSASSIHVHFLYDETVFRFVYRCDGQTAMASPVTPLYATAGNTQSSFVTLAAR